MITEKESVSLPATKALMERVEPRQMHNATLLVLLLPLK